MILDMNRRMNSSRPLPHPSAVDARAPSALSRRSPRRAAAIAVAAIAVTLVAFVANPIPARAAPPPAPAAASAPAQPLPYPPSPAEPVQDVFHGVTVTEDHRWLEDTDSQRVRDWVAAQNRLTRRVLDALPQRAALRAELRRMTGAGGRATRSEPRFAGGRLFLLKEQPPRDQAMLVVLGAGADLKRERVLVDPNRIDRSGKTAIDWYQPSVDGRLVAVSMSKNGSEDGTLYLFDTATGRRLPDTIPRVQYPTGGGSAAFDADGKGLLYTRYPQGSERPPADANFYQQVWWHRIGTPASADRYVLGADFPRIAEIQLARSEDGRHVLVDVANGDGGEHAFWLRSGDGDWTRLADFQDGVRNAVFGRDGWLYALALKGSPRGRIVATRLDAPQPSLADAGTVVRESEVVIEGLLPTATRLYVDILVGGPSEVRRYALEPPAAGETVPRAVPEGTVGATPIANVQLGARLAGDTVLFGSQSHVAAFAWYRHDPAAKPATVRTALSDPPAFAIDGGLPGIEVRRETVRSADGTPVPVTILARRGLVRDGSHPTLLTAYGGYGVSIRPWFSRSTALWLRHGGVWVLANLRGGGEFGEDWHLAGNLIHKQNVFDDFLAAAQWLVDERYTTPARLAIRGGSNGGLLMGAALTQRPALFRAVVSEVGLYDMLRVELTPNGAFNTTEFGSVKDEAQFRALYAYSPLHRVRDGTDYPAILLTTGEHDGRVAPWMSYKMAARLQSANPRGRPVLLRVASDAGHGIGTSLAGEIEEGADVFAFLFHELGMR